MSAVPDLQKRLASLGIEAGDEILVADGDRQFTGILIPHHDFSEPEVITLKLASGYNVGVRTGRKTSFQLKNKSSSRPFNKPRGEKVSRESRGLRKVAFVGTGGTIASFVDYRTGGVFPAIDASGIVSLVPEISSICSLEGKNLFSIFSENMGPKQWQTIATEVADRLNDGSSGVLISTGTDTLAYTAAALSFMLPGLSGPVVLVGAQRSPDRPSFDGYLNLICSSRVASSSDIGEVVVVMHATSSDSGCHVHRGTKVRKMHSSRRDAFRSINSEPIAFVDDDIHYISDYRRSSPGKVRADTRLDQDVALIQFYPGMKHSDLLAWTRGKKGIVVAGTGLGHVSSDLIPAIRKRVSEGVPVVLTTQCLFGSVDFSVYATGRDLIKAGAIDGGDMLPEVAYVKLMHVLAHHDKMESIAKTMQQNLAGELNPRRRGKDEF